MTALDSLAPARLMTLGDAYEGRKNCLNALRLVLAGMVLLAHAADIAGFSRIEVASTELGTIALYGFFGISGFLITKSAMTSSAGRYLWHRFLRIFPGFWFCLIVTAFVIAPLSWLFHPPACSSLACVLNTHNGSLGYVTHNSLLLIHQSSILGTPRHVAYFLIWNGSLWSLSYEFLCYLAVLAFAFAGFLQRRMTVVVFAALLQMAIIVITVNPSIDVHFTIFHFWYLLNFMKFLMMFLAGTLLYLYRDRVPNSALLALGSTVCFIAMLFLPTFGWQPAFTFDYPALAAPLLAYPLLWCGARFSSIRLGAKNDFSYGVYIFGFPVEQLLAVTHVQRIGEFGFIITSFVLTLALASVSWFVIEKNALRLRAVSRPIVWPVLRRPAELPSRTRS